MLRYLPLALASIVGAALCGTFTALGIDQGWLPEPSGGLPAWVIVVLTSLAGGLIPAVTLFIGDALGMSGVAADRYRDQR